MSKLCYVRIIQASPETSQGSNRLTVDASLKWAESFQAKHRVQTGTTDEVIGHMSLDKRPWFVDVSNVGEFFYVCWMLCHVGNDLCFTRQ